MFQSYYILTKKAIFWLILAALIVEPVVVSAKVPSDPGYKDQAPMFDQIAAPAAWDITTGSKLVTIAVIDTGADSWHEDISPNMWTNVFEIPGNGVDDDHNGYIDDIHGWNFADNNNDIRTPVSQDAEDPEAVRHGTVVAGLVGAKGNNDKYGVGINWNVRVMPLKAIDSSGGGSFYAVAQSVDYAVNNGADIISMSFVGQETNEQLRLSLERAYQKGIVVVAAVGNHEPGGSGNLEKTPTYPACYDIGNPVNWIVGVSAVNMSDRLAEFANYGSCVDIVAPGVNVFSTERYAPQYGYTDAFGGGWNGTSFATPLVAGTAALIKSLHPEWTPRQVIDVLLSTVDSVSDKNPSYPSTMGFGRLNVARAVGVAASDVEAGAPLGSAYFYKGSTLYRYVFDAHRIDTIAREPGATILGVTTAQNLGLYQRPAIMLIERGQYYYVRVIRADRTLVREFVLPTKTFNKKSAVPNGVKFLPGDGYDPSLFVVSGFDAKKKQTIFSSFTINGKQTKDLRVAGVVTAWDASKTSDATVWAQVKGTTLVITSYNWKSQEKFTYSQEGITRVEALKVGKVLDDNNEQAVAVIDRSDQVSRLVVNLSTFTASEASLGSPLNHAPWQLYISPKESDWGSYIIQFQKTGGYYRVVSGGDELVRRILLPSFEGVFE